MRRLTSTRPRSAANAAYQLRSFGAATLAGAVGASGYDVKALVALGGCCLVLHGAIVDCVTRRYALLDDNQRLLERRLADLAHELPLLVEGRVCAALVIGSVAEGKAHDLSDIDIVLVLCDETPRRSDYDWWDTEVQPRLPAAPRFPIQPVFIARDSLRTSEPHMRRALATGIPLWDPEEILGDQSEARA